MATHLEGELVTDHNGPGSVGVELMAKLVENLVLSNENAKATHELLAELRELLDELAGNFEVLNRTMAILDDVRAGGKKSFTIADLVAAWVSADEEIHEEEEPDQGDPLVGARE